MRVLLALGVATVFAVLASYVYSTNISSENIPSSVDDIRDIGAVVAYFKNERGRYPVDLNELVSEEMLPHLPRDPWGRPYHYSLSQPAGVSVQRDFYIWTDGADGMPGGASLNEDVGSWNVEL